MFSSQPKSHMLGSAAGCVCRLGYVAGQSCRVDFKVAQGSLFRFIGYVQLEAMFNSQADLFVWLPAWVKLQEGL